ncbi:MAG: rhodanese-like domain-containing protein [bacterium]
MHLPPVPHIDAADVDAALADGALLLDVREDEEYSAGHIADAVHVAMNTLPQRWREDPDLLAADRPIVVVCRVGSRSAAVTAWLRGQGFEASNLEGGMVAWAVQRRPMTSTDGSPARVA